MSVMVVFWGEVSGGRKCPVARAAAAAAVEDFGRRLLATMTNWRHLLKYGSVAVASTRVQGWGTNCEPTLRLPD